MPFVSLLRADQIAVRPPWCTFEETVDGLLDLLVRAGILDSRIRAEAASAIRAREREASTAMLETGVGIPHARIADLDTPVVALAVAPAGLYEAVPTVPIRIVALVLSPLASLEQHLHTLADIATSLRSPDLRAALLRAADAPAAFAILMQYARGLS